MPRIMSLSFTDVIPLSLLGWILPRFRNRIWFICFSVIHHLPSSLTWYLVCGKVRLTCQGDFPCPLATNSVSHQVPIRMELLPMVLSWHFPDTTKRMLKCKTHAELCGSMTASLTRPDIQVQYGLWWMPTCVRSCPPAGWMCAQRCGRCRLSWKSMAWADQREWCLVSLACILPILHISMTFE